MWREVQACRCHPRCFVLGFIRWRGQRPSQPWHLRGCLTRYESVFGLLEALQEALPSPTPLRYVP